jgi:hypothetical protein
MSDQTPLTSPPIAPVYVQTEPNQPIHIGFVPIQFGLKGTTYQETADVTMRLVPDDRLEFVCPLEGKSPFFALELIGLPDNNLEIDLKDRGTSFRAFCLAAGSDHGGIVFSPTQSGLTVTPPSNAISSVTFHLFNFPDFNASQSYILRTGEPPRLSAKRCGRVVLKADGWSITIAATDQTDSLVNKLKREGGFILTHVGQVVREDGAVFSSEQIQGVLDCVHYFLSFALGRWAGVALPIGFDADGKRVFEQWGVRRTADGPSNGSSWFDDRHGDLLSEVFPGFVALWKNDIWREPMTHALYWYLGACDRRVGIGVDTGLILAQTALETLAWTHCILERRMVSPSAFKQRGLSAADKLRLLVSSLGIPKEIPSELSALQAKKGPKWTDGLHAITAIRNSLVHSSTDADLPKSSYFEAWNLSMWYIELVLLRLCGHCGKYANRLVLGRWAGQVETVPWGKIESGKK